LKGVGVLYLTNLRTVLVSKNQQLELKGFEFRNYKVYNEKFEKPAFKQPYFIGRIKTYTQIFKKD